MRTLLLVLAVFAAVWLVVLGGLMVIGRKLAARRLFKLAPDLLFLFRGLIGDARIPRSSKIAMGLGAAWIASPIDLIPEFIPVLGALDDAVVAALVLRHVVRRAGADVVAEHWRGDEDSLRLVLRFAGARTT